MDTMRIMSRTLSLNALAYAGLLGCISVGGGVAGCGDTTADDDATADDDTSAACPLITATRPVADSNVFFYQDEISITFNTAPTGTVTITLTDGAGANVAGTTTASGNGRTFTFDPSADLDSSAPYAISIDWGCASAGPLNFTTGPFGEDVTTPESLVGKTYNLDLANATFVEPPGVGSILGSQLEGISVIFSAMPQSDFSVDPAALHIVGALGEDDNNGGIFQNLCDESLPFTFGDDATYDTADDAPATFDNPYMELNADALTLTVQGVSATIQNLLISGTFAPDLSSMAGGRFAGKIDTRPLAPVLDPNGDENAICELVMETVGVGCEECGGDNPGVFCLSVVAEDIVAAEIPGMTVLLNTCEDILLNTACSEEDRADCGAGDDDSAR
jgi:hypothetical protein